MQEQKLKENIDKARDVLSPTASIIFHGWKYAYYLLSIPYTCCFR